MVFKRIKKRFIIIFSLLITGAFLPDISGAKTITVKAPSPNFQGLNYQEFRGLPRLGEQDTSGLAATQYRNNDKALIKRINKKMADHNYTMVMLNRYGFMQKYNECFQNMTGYQVTVAACAGLPIDHQSQGAFWKKYIENMAYSLTPGVYNDLFCMGNDGCKVTTTKNLYKKNNKYNPKPLDEFEKRDFISRLMKAQHTGFERHWRSTTMPRQAYLVSQIRLSKYNFDLGQFSFTLGNRGMLSGRNMHLAQQNQSAIGLNHGRLALSGLYTPTLPFEDETKSSNRKVILPMAAGAARKIVQDGNKSRQYYAVMRITILENAAPKNGHEMIKLLSNPTQAYHYAENKIELFADEALTRKIAEIPLFPKAKKSAGDQGGKTSVNTYVFPQNSMFLDYRFSSLLRIKTAPLPDKILTQITRGISQGENKFWVNYNQRLKELDRLSNPVNIPTDEQAFLIKKKKAEDRTRLTHYSWQEFNKLSPAQRKDFFSYIMGSGKIDKGNRSLAWPGSLAPVPWGLNVMTVFKKDYLSGKQDYLFDPTNEKAKSTVQKFISAAANSRDMRHLTLITNIRDISYDENSRMLIIPKKHDPLHRVPAPLRYSDDTDSLDDTALSPRARGKVIYHFRTSDGYVGDKYPNPQINFNCATHMVRRSQDCATSYQSFTGDFNGYNMLALDRNIAIDHKIPMARDKALPLIRYGVSAGWRFVVELTDPEMDIHPFLKKNRPRETNTIFANVKRVLLLSPENEIIWSKNGTEFESAQAATTVTNDAAAAYRFPDRLNLHNQYQQLESVIFEFMLARYYPDRLTQKMLEGMLSSHWAYEQANKNPIGGRFFKQGAGQPSIAATKKMTGAFKKWLTATARKMPNEFALNVPLLYSNNTVATQASCVRLLQPKNAPLRNNPTAKILAEQKARQCNYNHTAEVSKFEQCETIRTKMAKAQNALTLAEKNNCKTPGSNGGSSPAEVSSSGTGPCNFPANMAMGNMQQEVQKCLLDKCGATPTTMAGVSSYQTCVQSVSQGMQQQLTQLLTGKKGPIKAPRKPKAKDSCKAARLQITYRRQDLRSFQCNSRLKRPAQPDCTVNVTAEVPDYMTIEKLLFDNKRSCASGDIFDRTRNASKILLSRDYYDETNFNVELFISGYRISYDPPFAVEEKIYGTNARVSAVIKITGVNEAATTKKKIAFNAAIVKTTYDKP